MIRSFTLVFLLLCLAAPAAQAEQGRIISAENRTKPAPWTASEKKAPVARRTLKQTSEASYHLIRLAGAEAPHIHQNHDLVVSILRGESRIYLGGKAFTAGRGDVIEIPRGMPHWVENAGSGPCVAYAVFTPPFDGKDEIPVNPASTT